MSDESKKEKKTNIEIIEYDDIPEPSFDGYYRVLDPKIIKYMCKRVRQTIEYKELVDYMKKTMNINHCSFYKDYSMANGFTVELHHSPFRLYDYVEAVARKFMSEDNEDPKFQCWAVEEEVNRLHYDFMVGLVPLNPTAHQLVHSGNLKIHPKMVICDWEVFVKEYKEFLSDEAVGICEEFRVLGTMDVDEIPEIVKYKPLMISNSKIKSLGSINVGQLIIDKLTRVKLESKKEV